MLTTSAVTTIGGQAYSIDQQRKAQKEAERASKLEERRARIQNQINARRAAAATRVEQARVQAAQAAMGGSTSGSANTLSALTSNLAGEQGIQQSSMNFMSRITDARNASNAAMGRASIGSAVSGLPGALGFGVGDILARRAPGAGAAAPVPGNTAPASSFMNSPTSGMNYNDFSFYA